MKLLEINELKLISMGETMPDGKSSGGGLRGMGWGILGNAIYDTLKSIGSTLDKNSTNYSNNYPRVNSTEYEDPSSVHARNGLDAQSDSQAYSSGSYSGSGGTGPQGIPSSPARSMPGLLLIQGPYYSGT
jgi:hypothetical protein